MVVSPACQEENSSTCLNIRLFVALWLTIFRGGRRGTLYSRKIYSFYKNEEEIYYLLITVNECPIMKLKQRCAPNRQRFDIRNGCI